MKKAKEQLTIFKAEKLQKPQELVASDTSGSGGEMGGKVGRARRIKEDCWKSIWKAIFISLPSTDNYCLIPRKDFISGGTMERGLGLGAPRNDWKQEKTEGLISTCMLDTSTATLFFPPQLAEHWQPGTFLKQDLKEPFLQNLTGPRAKNLLGGSPLNSLLWRESKATTHSILATHA